MFYIKPETLINDRITSKFVQLIDEEGQMLGKISTQEALNMAEEKNLDLVLMAPKDDAPVCKLMDYGKYKFEMMKKEKEAKKKQKQVELKEIRLSAGIDKHDIDTKMNNARKFIQEGNKVKITLRFKGREMNFTKNGASVLDNFAKELEEISIVERPAKLEGRNMSMIIAPKK